MNRAGTDDDEEAVQGILALDYGGGGVSSFDDGFSGISCLGDLMLEEVGRGERVVTTD
jgi:hypothetical protein